MRDLKKIRLSLELTFIVFATIFIPALTLAHELGHYLAAIFCGHDAIIHFKSVTYFGKGTFFGSRLIFSIGGPLVNLILTIICFLYLRKGFSMLAFWVVVASASRVILVWLATIFLKKNSDEFLIFFGWLWLDPIELQFAIFILYTMVYLLFLYFTLKRIRREYLKEIVVSFCGFIVGYINWFYVYGPVLLP